MNLLCGVLGVICTFNGDFSTAFCLMLAAAVCDFCDGLSARLLKAYSDVGKELDSLADLISFGMLPAIMLHKLMTETGSSSILCCIPLVIVVLSAVRLAKFNIDERQTENFLGLATPACAIWCGSLIYFVSQGYTIKYMPAHTAWFLPVVSVVLALLLVSEIPMFSMKFKKGSKTNRIRLIFIALIAATGVLSLIFKTNWSFIILSAMTLYILWNVMRAISSRNTGI
jgi:CDP-diacylglycerol--serine O-phosphatidyltransferase